VLTVRTGSLSQALRDDAAFHTPTPLHWKDYGDGARVRRVDGGFELQRTAELTAEWAVEVFKQQSPAAFAPLIQRNATPQVLDYLRPWTDCYKNRFEVD